MCKSVMNILGEVCTSIQPSLHRESNTSENKIDKNREKNNPFLKLSTYKNVFSSDGKRKKFFVRIARGACICIKTLIT